MAHNGTLSAKQNAAVLALLSERDNLAAARRVGISARTLHRWLGDPGFTVALRNAQAGLFDNAARALAADLLAALNTLNDLHKDPTIPASVRRAAASDIIGHALKLRELTEIERRLTAIEAVLMGQGEK